LNFQLSVRSCSIENNTAEKPNDENTGLAVAILSISRLELELCVVDFMRPPSTSGFFPFDAIAFQLDGWTSKTLA